MASESRFAELAMELIGSKAASEFLQEAWAHASEDTKKELADAFVVKMTDLVSSSDYDTRRIFQEALHQRLREEATRVVNAELKSEMLARYAQILLGSITESVAKVAAEDGHKYTKSLEIEFLRKKISMLQEHIRELERR